MLSSIFCSAPLNQMPWTLCIISSVTSISTFVIPFHFKALANPVTSQPMPTLHKITYFFSLITGSSRSTDTTSDQRKPNQEKPCNFQPLLGAPNGRLHRVLPETKAYLRSTTAIWLIGKDPDAGRDWGQEEKGTTEDEMAGWHHRLDGLEFEWTPGVGDGQGGLVCCNSWGHKESDTTERLNWTEPFSHRLNILSSIHGPFIKIEQMLGH